MELNQISKFNFLRSDEFQKIVKEINNLSQKEFIKFLHSPNSELKDDLKDSFLEIMNDIKSNLIKMDYESRINLLIELLQFQFENYVLNTDSDKNLYIINEIVSCWSNDDSDIEAIEGVIGDLAGTYNCPKKILKFLVQSSYKHLNPTMILETHIRTRGDEGFVFSYVAERILEAYEIDNLPESDWSILYDIIDIRGVENPEDLEYIKLKSSLNFKNEASESKTLKKPKWILSSGPQVSEAKLGSKAFKLNSSDLDLKSEINKYIHPEEIKSRKIEFSESEVLVAPLTRDEVIKNFKALGFCHFNSPSESSILDELIRRYGPINEIEDIECSSHPMNSDSKSIDTGTEKKGFPCQMLYCMCRETDELGTETFETFEAPDGNDGNFVSWFNGICIECHCKIKKLEHAVRFPVEDGGWIGCFCGFECMKKSEIRPMYKSDMHRINEVHKILDEIGIYEKINLV